MAITNNTVKALKDRQYTNEVLLEALLLKDDAQQELFELARERRAECFPDNRAQARSVIEISNLCRQRCRYCSIGGKNQKINYSLDANQMEMLMDHLYGKGRRVVLLQSGENPSEVFIRDVVTAIGNIKLRHKDLRIILCMGDLSRDQYQRLYDAGATDYVIKFEASNEELFKYCKPNDDLDRRLKCIMDLSDIGYRVGSGNIVGLPRQTLEDLVSDLQLVQELPLGMNSTTIFIPAEDSEFAAEPAGDPNLTLNMMAIMRIMNPYRLMPTTSSLEKMIPDGQYLGLMAGANTITIHDGTPEELQAYFPIYSTHRVRPQIEHFRDILNRANMTADICE
ncbi:MAG: radical SAM protein [Lachnospiraceae bacterium]|nr:radical SAM protein [Lachnospiraceae bacterium]